MDGYTLIRRVRELLGETVGGSFMNDRTSYDCLYDAVKDFNKRTHYLMGVQTINVPSGVSVCDLNPDFVDLALDDRFNKPYIKYTANGADNFIFPQDYNVNVLANDTSTAPVPASFSIVTAPQMSTYTSGASSQSLQVVGLDGKLYYIYIDANGQLNWSDTPLGGGGTSVPWNELTGTAKANGAKVNGECTLTDTGASFWPVSVGDYVHNLTDTSHGVVVARLSGTQVVCAMFEGVNNAWTNGDSYIIVPQVKRQLILTPTPSVNAVVTVSYEMRPNPVYSPYRTYNLPTDAELPVCQFAAFLYKYKDREPNFGDALYKYYDLFTRRASAEYMKGIPGGQGFTVNMSKWNKRSTGQGSWR